MMSMKLKTEKSIEGKIKKYFYLVKFVVYVIIRYVPHGLEKKDIESYGLMGLIKAINKYDYKQNLKFENYAIHIIKHTILDEIRKIEKDSRCKNKIDKFLSLDYEYDNGEGQFSLHDFVSDNGDELVKMDSKIDKEFLIKNIKEFLKEYCSFRERVIFILYYIKEIDMKQIADIFDVTPSRISQICNDILAVLKKEFKGYEV